MKQKMKVLTVGGKDYLVPSYLVDITENVSGDATGSLKDLAIEKLRGNSVPDNAEGYLHNDGSGTLAWSAPPSSIAWGEITGTITDQHDLAAIIGSLDTATYSGENSQELGWTPDNVESLPGLFEVGGFVIVTDQGTGGKIHADLEYECGSLSVVSELAQLVSDDFSKIPMVIPSQTFRSTSGGTIYIRNDSEGDLYFDAYLWCRRLA